MPKALTSSFDAETRAVSLDRLDVGVGGAPSDGRLLSANDARALPVEGESP